MLERSFNFITNNSFASALVAAATLGSIAWIGSAFRNYRDSKLIYEFMLSSKADTNFNFRSTQAIASHTRLPEDRVAALCAKHPKIRRNSNEKQSWVLSE